MLAIESKKCKPLKSHKHKVKTILYMKLHPWAVVQNILVIVNRW